MEQDRRLQLIDNAIQKLIHDTNTNTNKVQESHHNNDAQYQNALSHLLSVSQSNILKGEEIPEQYEGSRSSDTVGSVIEAKEGEDEGGGSENDEIMKELKKVSEVSLILQLKDGLSHPFRSFGNILKGMVKVPDVKGQDADDREELLESSSSLPSMVIPDMSHNIGN
ncbi:uncharacterized protein LOC114163442 isoform X2 [Vigna unguiculata]|uniref:uncharacterized protein LOC114163442 isoform X2 n=1 Tax=Vigna unguiculata TaxID=3917 RepID=UPI001016E53D|nr:uncharacterized protein LOC114163442 isoform X2 [Vigna unguiculata]